MFLPALTPTFDAALRDVRSADGRFRLAAAERLADAPVDRESDACTGLIVLANDDLGPIRAAALSSLERLGELRGLHVARKRIDDEHRATRCAAVRAAASLDEDSVQWLPGLLDDPRVDIRAEAILALGEHGGARVAPWLERGLQDEDEHVRGAAAAAVGDLGLDALVVPLRALLTDGPSAAFSAAVALAAMGHPSGEAVLIAALADRDVALHAAEALGEIATGAGRDALARHAARPFAPLLLRAAAGAALARQGDARGEAALARVIEAWRADGRDYAVHAVGELGLANLVPALLRLARRLRGADPRVLASALDPFAAHDSQVASALAVLRSKFGLAVPIHLEPLDLET